MAYQQDGFLPRPFTIESGRFKDYYFTGKGKNNQESYAVYTHVKSHEVAMDADYFKLYQICMVCSSSHFEMLHSCSLGFFAECPNSAFCMLTEEEKEESGGRKQRV